MPRIDDIIELKKFLMERKELVARCLTEKMLIYAIGRKLEVLDRGSVEQIVSALNAKSNGLRDLVCLVVTSNIFLSK